MADRRYYYTEGSAARSAAYYGAEAPAVRRSSAVPAERPEPRERRRQPQPGQEHRRNRTAITPEEQRRLMKKKSESRAVANAQIRYTTGVVVAVIIAVALCCYLLKLTSDVRQQKTAVSKLKTQVAEQVEENAGYKAGLDSMVDLNEIYQIATTKLGMVYSQPGQTLYYRQNNEDYVVQYQNVPEVE